MNGWAGLSLVCYGTPLEAAQMSCAGTHDCVGVSGSQSSGVGGSLVFPIETVTGAATIAVQPCARLDAEFFSGLLPVVVPAVLAILLARRVWRIFDTHA